MVPIWLTVQTYQHYTSERSIFMTQVVMSFLLIGQTDWLFFIAFGQLDFLFCWTAKLKSFFFWH